MQGVIDYWIDNPEEAKAYEKKYLDSAKVFNQEECMKEMEEMMFEVIREKSKETKEKTTLS